MDNSLRDSAARAFPAYGYAKRGPLPRSAPEMAHATDEVLRQMPSVVHRLENPPRPTDEAPDTKPGIGPSNRVFRWLVGVGLGFLLALLAGLLLNAGINVEVVP